MKKEALVSLLQKKGGGYHLTRVRHARTPGGRFRGLLGETREGHTYGLVFHLPETGILGASIHMLFMKMPIDILWLDEDQKIVDSRSNVPPWTVNCSPRQPARYIIELPVGTISPRKNIAGMRVSW